MTTINNLSKMFLGMFLLVCAMSVSNGSKLNLPSIPTSDLKVIDKKQLICMANNIYYEAGSETKHGMAAVARVVMNRVAHGFGRTPCEVIYQVTKTVNGKTCQFSWVCENNEKPNIFSARYKKAEQIAYDVLVNNRYDEILPKSTLFFHNLTVNPMWPYRQVAIIGNHIFYSKSKHNQSN